MTIAMAEESISEPSSSTHLVAEAGKHPSQYDGLIKPTRKVNDDLITDEWENIQRIMVSLALKTTTQSIIVGKLSSYARKNKTRRALWEYDGIIRSLFLLEYIDSPPLRRNVQRALNRGEKSTLAPGFPNQWTLAAILY